MPDSDTAALRRELRKTGLSPRVIRAAWPEWWSSEAAESLSARTELRYTLARRLGISPQSIFDGQPKFIWHDEAKFKNLGTTSEQEQAILTSFGISVGRSVLQGAPVPEVEFVEDPSELRRVILASASFVGLEEILSACWAFGIPVISPTVLPLPNKRMHAMTVSIAGKFSVLLGQDSKHPARMAFTLAHEMGHIALGHVNSAAALLEMEDPLQWREKDSEEEEADRYALELLTGDPNFEIHAEMQNFNAANVVAAVSELAPTIRVSPGVIALSLGHSTGKWAQVYGALNRIDGEHKPGFIGPYVNLLAQSQVRWDTLAADQRAYLESILGLE